MIRKSLKRYLEAIGPVAKGDEVIIESWNSQTALWGELLASRLNGRHIFWTANEAFRDNSTKNYQCYEEKIDFYMFKMDRGEIFTDVSSANALFIGYRTYKNGDFLESFITEDPVQDIDCPRVNAIAKSDWNICYIGRANKPYVPYIFEDVGRFARRHPEKNIQFLVVGEVFANKEVLQGIKDIPNLKVVELGDLYPIPRSLYSKVDVVIAGSGSARHSMDEDALVISADSQLNNSHGILGYDTNESIYKEDGALDMTFDEALERALVEKTWTKQENKWIKMPGIKECTERQFEIINRAAPNLEYYDERKLLSGKIDFYRILLFVYRGLRVRFE